MYNFFKKIWYWLFGTKSESVFTFKYVEDNPKKESVKENILYVVGNKEYQKWAYLKCPCECGDVIMLSLNQERFPSWSVKLNENNQPSIYPSVHRLDDCRSHFWMKEGKIIWTND